MLHYVCKYTPIEMLRALGADPQPLDGMRASFDEAEQVAGPNICGFGKTVLEAVFAGEVSELVLANCCDTIRTVHDILRASGKLDFLYLLDLPHCADACARERFAEELRKLAEAYTAYAVTRDDAGCADDESAEAITPHTMAREAGDAVGSAISVSAPACDGAPYVAILGARAGAEVESTVRSAIDLPVRNLTCVNGRAVEPGSFEGDCGDSGALERYAEALLEQMPCMRMFDPSMRSQLALDPNLAGVVYHTVRFCDFYGMEFASVQSQVNVPVLKVESDYTTQGAGQLLTRVQAFAETLGVLKTEPQESASAEHEGKRNMATMYFAGVDSGSTSTDAVVIDGKGAIAGYAIIPTGAGSAASGTKALETACAQAGIDDDQIANVVATGYGREAVKAGGRTVTEITCHARGAHEVDPRVRTVVDIGGQDSKAIALDEDGRVVNFAMNDKCAAGTGRFLEMMARTLELELPEMAQRGIHPPEDIAISSTCSVFAESEVVSLIAQGKDVDSIVHGLNAAVAVRAQALVRRVQGEGPYMMTGGVAQNAGVVEALSDRLGSDVIVDERCQILGAYGAALIAAGL